MKLTTQKELKDLIAGGNFSGDYLKDILMENVDLDFSDLKVCESFQRSLAENMSMGNNLLILAFIEKYKIKIDFSDKKIQYACRNGLVKHFSKGNDIEAESVIRLAKREGIILNLSEALIEALVICLEKAYYVKNIPFILTVAEKYGVKINLCLNKKEIKDAFNRGVRIAASLGNDKMCNMLEFAKKYKFKE